jgi:CMP-N-acetylneuraminic acid synthetase
VVSSEDEATLGVAVRFGAEALARPVELAGDTVWDEPVLAHALKVYPGYHVVCWLYPAAGVFISSGTLQNAYQVFRANPAKHCIAWLDNDKPAGQFYFLNTVVFLDQWGDGVEINNQPHVKYWLDARHVLDLNTMNDWQAMEQILYGDDKGEL